MQNTNLNLCLVQRFPLATTPSWLSSVRTTRWGSWSWDQRCHWLQVRDLPSHLLTPLDLTCSFNRPDFFLPGIVDDLKAAGVPCFGPSAKAAQLEASKSFSKAFMERQGIPTARYGSFSDPQEACTFIRTSVHTETTHIWRLRRTFLEWCHCSKLGRKVSVRMFVQFRSH